MNDHADYLVIDCDGVNDFYRDMVDALLEKGKDVAPRGLPTKEIRPAMVIIKKPQERFLTCPGRLIHPYFQVMESIWILAGRGDLWFIRYYLRNMEKYADGRNEFHAPYGIRMRRSNRHRDMMFFRGVRDQLWDCYRSLQKDSETRQAVMTYWNPALDHFQTVTNDRPCNIAFQFLIRDGKLDLTIFNRSNDLNWGLAHTNVVQFSVLLETMAMLLDIPVGNQIHMINSLHIYDYQGELTQRVLSAKYSFNVYENVYPLSFKMDLPDKFKLSALDQELKSFFRRERDIRKGEFGDEDSELSFNYLQDALVLAKSFWYCKMESYDFAAEEISLLQADDLFVSCLEFVARKIGFEMARKIAFDRFGERLSIETLNNILEYVEGH